MIKAKFSKRGREFSVEIKGHSGAAPEGCDIVCAAVSAGLQFLYHMLLSTNKDAIRHIKIERGFGKITFLGGEREEGAYLMLCHGLLALSKDFPNYLEVK